jgi:hypothetical protein
MNMLQMNHKLGSMLLGAVPHYHSLAAGCSCRERYDDSTNAAAAAADTTLKMLSHDCEFLR